MECYDFSQGGERVRNKQRLLMRLNKHSQEGRVRRNDWKKRAQSSSFVNDIAGWAVGRDNEEHDDFG